MSKEELSIFLLYSDIFRIILLAPACPIILIFKIREKLKEPVQVQAIKTSSLKWNEFTWLILVGGAGGAAGEPLRPAIPGWLPCALRLLSKELL